MLTRLRLCILFSTQKSTHIKIPPTNASQPTQQKSPKIIKLSRKKITQQLLKQSQPQYTQNTVHRSKTQTAYHLNIQNKINNNLATHKFYQYQLNRGQDLIDNVPIDPYYQYKFADIKMEMQERKKFLQEFQGIKTFTDTNRHQKLKSLISGYQTMKHRYQIQQFYKDIKKYPGSVKGPNPQDDPHVYNEYIRSIIPQWVRAEILLKNQQSKIQVQSGLKNSPSIGRLGTDYLSQQPKLVPPQDPHFDQEMLQDLQNAPMITRYSAVAELPHTRFQEYHSYMEKIKMWAKFRKYYDRVNMKKNIKNLQNSLSDIGTTQLQRRAGTKDLSKLSKQQFKQLMSTKIQPKIYSLYTYYKTLPKEVQEHPGVRTAYLGLQYCSPQISYEEKQQLLNQAAYMSLPLDKFSGAAMTQLLQKDRMLLDPHLVDRIFNMNPEFTWDIQDFLNEIKNQKLRSISTVKEKQLSFPQPPQVYKMSQQGMANLPVDFYDNEDGFWDDYIDRKLQRYQKVQPLSQKPKKHFVH